MMVAAVSATPNPKTSSREGSHQNPARPPLIPSEADNGVAFRRPKGREVTSCYFSSSTSTSTSSSTSSSSSFRRCASPLVSRTAPSSAVMTPMPALSSLIKRSQFVEWRRVVTPRPSIFDFRPGNAGEVTTATKMLITSARSLSVSFQGESFLLRVSKTKPAPASVRKGTPERRKPMPMRADQTENSKPVGQHLWPGRSRQVNSLTRSMDCTDEKRKLEAYGNFCRLAKLQSLQNYMKLRVKFPGFCVGCCSVTAPTAAAESAFQTFNDPKHVFPFPWPVLMRRGAGCGGSHCTLVFIHRWILLLSKYT